MIIYKTRKRLSCSPTSASCPEFGVSCDDEEPAALQDTLLPGSLKESSQLYLDTNSEHSSGKDSGTGDSSKRSSDDLIPPEDHQFPLLDASLSGTCFYIFYIKASHNQTFVCFFK